MKSETGYSLSSIVKILSGLIVVILVFYGLTVFLESRNTVEESVVEAEIQYEEILMGSIYKGIESEYYVLAVIGEDIPELYSSFTNYQTVGELSIYKVDMDNVFNKNYLASESNYDNYIPIISETTLFKIVDSKVASHTEGIDEIKSLLE